jgi:hypothetical protein
MADGATFEQAVANAQKVIEELIETGQELNRPIPEPRGRLMYAECGIGGRPRFPCSMNTETMGSSRWVSVLEHYSIRRNSLSSTPVPSIADNAMF